MRRRIARALRRLADLCYPPIPDEPPHSLGPLLGRLGVEVVEGFDEASTRIPRYPVESIDDVPPIRLSPEIAASLKDTDPMDVLMHETGYLTHPPSASWGDEVIVAEAERQDEELAHIEAQELLDDQEVRDLDQEEREAGRRLGYYDDEVG